MELNAEAEEGGGDPNKRSNDSMSDATTTGSNEAMEIDNVKNISETAHTGVVINTTDDALNSGDLLENSESTSGNPPKKFTARQYKKWLVLQSKIEKKYGKTNEGLNIAAKTSTSNQQCKSLNPRVVIARMTVDNITGTDDSRDTTQTDIAMESSDPTQNDVALESSDTTQTDVAAESRGPTQTGVAAKSSDITTTAVAAESCDTTQAGVTAKSNDAITTGVAVKSNDTIITDVAAKSSDTTNTSVGAKNIDTTTTSVAAKSNDTAIAGVPVKSSDATQTGIAVKGSDTTQIDVTGSTETIQIDDEEKISDTAHNIAGEAQRKFTAKHPQKVQEFQKVIDEKDGDSHKDEPGNIVDGNSASAERCKTFNPKVLIVPMDLTVIGKDKPVNISSSIQGKENNSDPKVEILSAEANVVETSHPGQQEDNQRQEKLQIKVNNTSSAVVQSVSNTTDENFGKPALNGVQKFLQLMNLLNKNPEKCKKWLQHQELQKQKLGDKYKEPIIYSTVKQISLSQIGMNKSSDERPVPKVQNSLDLLNILYLNPDKCTNWLIKQEALRKQHGKKYQQPVIYSTVRLIAADHLKQANANKSSVVKPISDNVKDTVHQCTNESKNTKVTTESSKTATSNNESTSNTEKKYKIPKLIPDNKRQLIEVNTKTVPEVSKMVPSVPKKISIVPEIVDTDKNVAETSERDSNTVEELPVRPEDQVFLLIPPTMSFFSKGFLKTLRFHADLVRKGDSTYKLPRYDYKGKQLPFGPHSSKDIFRIPLRDSTFKIIKCQPEMRDNFLFDWMFKQLLQMESFRDLQLKKWEANVTSEQLTAVPNADIFSSVAGNVLPPANKLLFPCAPILSASSPAVYFGAAPTEPVMSSYTHTGSFFGPVNSGVHFQLSAPIVPSVSPIGPPALCQTTPVIVPPASAVGPSAPTVKTPSPSATNTSAKSAIPSSAKPLDKTSKSPTIISISNVPLPSGKPTAQGTITPIMKSDNSTTANRKRPSKLNHSNDFDFTNCAENVAFRYKGNNVFYPKHVSISKYEVRKKWVDRQLNIHKQRGNKYCPPYYDEKGVSIPRRFEQNKTTASIPVYSGEYDEKGVLISRKLEQNKTTEFTIDSALKGNSIEQCILNTMESHLSEILLPPEVERINQLKKKIVIQGKCLTFDKFGMRINPENITKSEPTKRTYDKSTSKADLTKKPVIQSKPASKLSDVFDSEGKKIQLEKVKINMKLKKDEKPAEKIKEKSKSKSPTPAIKTSTSISFGSAEPSPNKRSKYEFTPRYSGVPRDMASKWFSTPPPSANQSGIQQAPAPYSPVTYPGFPVTARQQPAPVNQPPAPVRLPPAPVRHQLAPVSHQPAPVRQQPAHVRLPPAPVPAPPAPVRMPTMRPSPPVIAPQGMMPRAPVAGVLEPERGLGKGKLSAFERLGPPMEAKKPKLTINLMFTKDEKNEVVREVVEEHVPVYLRHDILSSRDVIVKEYLKVWPWSRPVKILKESSHSSKDLLLDEYEMTTCYNSKSSWVKVSVTRYPQNFKKEDVLDLLLKYVDKREFIPCFIEFKQEECTFLLNRSEGALTYLHKNGLVAEKDGVKLYLTVGQTNLTLDNLRFYKGAVFKAKLNHCYDANTNTLNLSAFQMQPDNSHFMYFPQNISYNQIFILNVVKAILPWNSITTLDLSGNRLESMYFLNIAEHFPSLRVLNLSNNLLATVSTLACFKGIPMDSLYLEGNPLCLNFIEKDHYLEVVKLIFPRLLLLDGEKINTKVDIKRNFSVSSNAQELVNAFLEMFFTLTDSNDRLQMESLYAENAVFSITCRAEMKRNKMYHNLKEFYMWCRSLNESINPLDPLEGTIVGGPKIVRYFTKWPMVVHDPHTFTVDVMHHTENATILKVTGLFKIPAESLSQEEPIMEFSRTFILTTEDGAEYKIVNDMMYISDATQERLRSAFQVVTLQHTNVDSLSLKLETAPDDELKDKFTEIVMQLTGLQRKLSQRCLELMDWNLRKSLEYFIRLEKLGTTDTLDF